MTKRETRGRGTGDVEEVEQAKQDSVTEDDKESNMVCVRTEPLNREKQGRRTFVYRCTEGGNDGNTDKSLPGTSKSGKGQWDIFSVGRRGREVPEEMGSSKKRYHE